MHTHRFAHPQSWWVDYPKNLFQFQWTIKFFWANFHWHFGAFKFSIFCHLIVAFAVFAFMLARLHQHFSIYGIFRWFHLTWRYRLSFQLTSESLPFKDENHFAWIIFGICTKNFWSWKNFLPFFSRLVMLVNDSTHDSPCRRNFQGKTILGEVF